MTLETDADRLAMIRALDGVEFSCVKGTFWGLFDAEFVSVPGGEMEIDSNAPRITVRSSDAKRCGLANGAVIAHGTDRYVVRSTQPDGTGMHVLTLEGP